MSKQEQELPEEEPANNAEDIVNNAQNQIEKAIENLKENPEEIKNIIELRRKANNEIFYTAKECYEARGGSLSHFQRLFDEAKKKGGDYPEQKNTIAKIIEELNKIQGFIDSTKKNLSGNISSTVDKALDKGQKGNILIRRSDTLVPRERLWTGDYGDNMSYDHVPSLQQLEEELKHTIQTRKIWEKLSKTQADDDRSKGHAELSDNLASMAMNGINIGRQGIAFAQALLTYAVVDVLYLGLGKGIVQGGVKGLLKGFNRTNDVIKAAANAMYQIKKGADRQLKKTIAEQVKSIQERLELTLQAEKHKTLNQNLKALSNVKDLTERVDQFKEAVGLFNQGQDESERLYQSNIQEIEKAVSTRNEIMDSKPNLATKGVAALGGAGVAIVGAILGAISQGIYEPLKQIHNIGDLVSKRYANIKPEQRTGWNKDRTQVKQEIKERRIAETQIEYAKKTNPKGKFTESLKTEREKAKGKSGEMGH